MLKQISLSIAAAALLTISCSVKEDRINCNFPVPVHVNLGNFGISEEEFTSKAVQDIGDYGKIKAVTLAFYHSDGVTRTYCETQLKADASTYETFGAFDLELPVGTYTLIALAYGSDNPVLFNSPTEVCFDEEKARETFCYVQNVTVAESTPLDITATLNRISTRLDLRSTDTRPAEVKTIRISFSKGGKGFNPLTGFTTSDSGFSSEVIPSTAVDESTLSTVHFFLAGDEETMDVTIETLDEDGSVIHSRTATGVPFKPNRVTVLRGPLYVFGSAGGTLTAETGFLDDLELTF